jgi:hypothetical protein
MTLPNLFCLLEGERAILFIVPHPYTTRDAMTDERPAPSSPLRRALIVAGVVVLVAWGSKLYRDQKRAIEGADPDAVADILSEVHQRAVDAELDPASLATPAPAAPPCGELRHPTSQAGPWRALLPDDLEHLTYQLMLRTSRTSADLTWIARRDTDCDGIFEVHTLRAPPQSGGDRTKQVVLQNQGE